MIKEDSIDPVGSYENRYFAVINEHGVIQYANDELIKCIHVDNDNAAQEVFLNFLSGVDSKNLKEALQLAGFAANPSYLKIDLLNSCVHKLAWHITRLKTNAEKPALFICIGHDTKNEKPTDKGSNELAKTP